MTLPLFHSLTLRGGVGYGGLNESVADSTGSLQEASWTSTYCPLEWRLCPCLETKSRYQQALHSEGLCFFSCSLKRQYYSHVQARITGHHATPNGGNMTDTKDTGLDAGQLKGAKGDDVNRSDRPETEDCHGMDLHLADPKPPRKKKSGSDK